MTGRKYSIFLSTLLVIAGLGATSPSTAHDREECDGTPLDAVAMLPSPLRKWGQIDCTPVGQVLASHDGWIWASLKDATKVVLPAEALSTGPAELGDLSYFTKIEAHELHQDELASALSAFHDGLEFKESDSKVYRVNITIASGGVASLLFFDFGAFAGGMWCPEDGCVEESRFLIMKQENKGQIITASILNNRRP
jgi:hypothetical protein